MLKLKILFSEQLGYAVMLDMGYEYILQDFFDTREEAAEFIANYNQTVMN